MQFGGFDESGNDNLNEFGDDVFELSAFPERQTPVLPPSVELQKMHLTKQLKGMTKNDRILATALTSDDFPDNDQLDVYDISELPSLLRMSKSSPTSSTIPESQLQFMRKLLYGGEDVMKHECTLFELPGLFKLETATVVEPSTDLHVQASSEDIDEIGDDVFKIASSLTRQMPALPASIKRQAMDLDVKEHVFSANEQLGVYDISELRSLLRTSTSSPMSSTIPEFQVKFMQTVLYGSVDVSKKGNDSFELPDLFKLETAAVVEPLTDPRMQASTEKTDAAANEEVDEYEPVEDGDDVFKLASLITRQTSVLLPSITTQKAVSSMRVEGIPASIPEEDEVEYDISDLPTLLKARNFAPSLSKVSTSQRQAMHELLYGCEKLQQLDQNTFELPLIFKHETPAAAPTLKIALHVEETVHKHSDNPGSHDVLGNQQLDEFEDLMFEIPRSISRQTSAIPELGQRKGLSDVDRLRWTAVERDNTSNMEDLAEYNISELPGLLKLRTLRSAQPALPKAQKQVVQRLLYDKFRTDPEGDAISELPTLFKSEILPFERSITVHTCTQADFIDAISPVLESTHAFCELEPEKEARQCVDDDFAFPNLLTRQISAPAHSIASVKHVPARTAVVRSKLLPSRSKYTSLESALDDIIAADTLGETSYDVCQKMEFLMPTPPAYPKAGRGSNQGDFRQRLFLQQRCK